MSGNQATKQNTTNMKHSEKVKSPKTTADLYQLIGLPVWHDLGRSATCGKIESYDWETSKFLIRHLHGEVSTADVCYCNTGNVQVNFN